MKPLKYWSPKGFEISSYRWSLSERINKQYKTSGSDNTGLCTYTYNELGFRGDSIHKTGLKIMSIGCSNTEGVGLNDNETWPHQFSKLIPNGVDMNFGCGGRSNDYISRCLLSYYDLIKPDLVLIMYTSPQRREVYTDINEIAPFMPTGAWGWFHEEEAGKKTQKLLTDLQNDNEDFINWYKNHLLIKYFLESKKCNWLWNGWFGIPKNYIDANRFDGNYFSPQMDNGVDGIHPGPLTNYTYAHNVYEYIRLNFPVYNLPKKLI
jgi:hypothetical protein